MPLTYKHGNVVLAKSLRKAATPQENRLWYDFLAKYRPRFQRQKPIDNFIADFYCHKAKLVIEIDGLQHTAPKEMRKDGFRTQRLEEYGLTVIRFTNKEIDDCFVEVCTHIDTVVKELI